MDKGIIVILARAGSKRIPNKNKRNFCGKPLIFWTIEAAIESQIASEIIVSTDDQDILAFKESFPEVHFLKRPEALATDEAKSSDAIVQALYNKKNFDFVVLLQPTSPLRDRNHIRKAFELYSSGQSKQIVSVTKPEVNSHHLYSYLPGEGLTPGISQNVLSTSYVLNGAIYISDWKLFEKSKSFLTKLTIPFIMDPEVSIDIDTEADWCRAEAVAQRRLNREQ